LPQTHGPCRAIVKRTRTLYTTLHGYTFVGTSSR